MRIDFRADSPWHRFAFDQFEESDLEAAASEIIAIVTESLIEDNRRAGKDHKPIDFFRAMIHSGLLLGWGNQRDENNQRLMRCIIGFTDIMRQQAGWQWRDISSVHLEVSDPWEAGRIEIRTNFMKRSPMLPCDGTHRTKH
jgi:hypothetical protein